MDNKKNLTTGEIAKFCGVTLKTVLRWIERGELKAFKLPGARGDNRIELNDFLLFLKSNNLPIPQELKPGKKRVLIVDDEIEFAKSIQRTFRMKGYETKIASDGFSAGAILGSFKPDLVTLDLNMPAMSGKDVVRFIRENPDFTDTKILLLSALGKSEIDDAMKIGADDACMKGVSQDEFLAHVHTLIGE